MPAAALKLLIVESHPIQYRAPVYAELNRLCPGSIPVGSASHLASALVDLSRYPRSFTWAGVGLQGYSIEAAARSLADSILEL